MAFPTTSVLDAFNRTDETILADPPWIKLFTSGNPLQLASNHVISNGGTGAGLYTNSGAAVYSPQTGSGIEIFYTILTNTVTTDRYGLEMVTVASSPTTDTPNGYEIDIQRTSNTWRVKRADAGVNTAIGADFTQAVASGDKVGVQIYKSGSDTIIDVYYKASAGSWGLLFSRTDTGVTTYMVDSYIGMYIQNATNVCDDFGGGNVVGGLTAAQMRPAFAQATENSNAMIGRVWE